MLHFSDIHQFHPVLLGLGFEPTTKKPWPAVRQGGYRKIVLTFIYLSIDLKKIYFSSQLDNCLVDWYFTLPMSQMTTKTFIAILTVCFNNT